MSAKGSEVQWCVTAPIPDVYVGKGINQSTHTLPMTIPSREMDWCVATVALVHIRPGVD